jgi:hypothetical protein
MIEIAIGFFAGAIIAGLAWAIVRAQARKREEEARRAQMTGALRARDLGLAEYKKHAPEIPKELYSFELVRAPKHEVQDVMSGEAKGRKILSCTLIRKLAGGPDESSIYSAELSLEAPHFAICPPGLTPRFRTTDWEPIASVPDEAFCAAFYGFMPDSAKAADFLTPKLREFLAGHTGWAWEFFHRRVVLAAPQKLRGNEARRAMTAVAEAARLSSRA